MIILKDAAEVLEILTTTVADIDYSITYTEFPSSVTPYSSIVGKINTGGTTFIAFDPQDLPRRGITLLSIRNIHLSLSNTITVKKQIAALTYVLTPDVTLLPGESYEYDESNGWTYYASDGTVKSKTTGIIAGGDLSGTYPNPTVSKILGNTVPVNALGYMHNDGIGNLSWMAAGTGTVTSVSGVTANGFSWSIANPTTTPALTLVLQNATTSQSGQLTSTDWNTFNGKLGTLLTSAFVFVGSGANVATGVAIGGDITIGNTGIVAIGASKVTNAMLAGSISNANLANSAITINGTSTSLGGSISVGTILGSIAATSGLIPYGTGTANTVTSTAGFNFDGTGLNIGTPAQLLAGGLFYLKASSGVNFGCLENASATGSNKLFFNESVGGNLLASLARYGSSTAGNLIGSIPKAGSIEFYNGGLYQSQFLFGGNPIINVIGTTTTNLGTRLDSAGLRIDQTANLHTSNTIALHVIKTTEQLRVGYDASNYRSLTISSTGSATYDLTGTTPTFTFNKSLKLGTAGNGFFIKEGTNATMGIGTLVGGVATVATTKITASSRIFIEDTGGGVFANIGVLIHNKVNDVVGTSFEVKSNNALDTSTFDWVLFEPA